MDSAPEVYRTAFEAAPDAMALVNPQTGLIRDCNARFRDLCGVDPGQACDREVATLFAATAATDLTVEDALTRSDNHGPTEWVLHAADTRKRVVASLSTARPADEPLAVLRVSPVSKCEDGRMHSDAGADGPVGASIDRHVAVGEHEQYERLVEHLPIGVYRNTAGPEGRFTLLNDAMVEIFDADSKSQLREQSVSDLYVDPAQRAAFSERLREDGIVRERELRLETIEGREIRGAVTAVAREIDGETVFDGVVRDVTERVEYEQRLEEQRDNLDILNRMLRHDIRNDLQLVTAYAGLLADRVDGDGAEYVETIRESAEHSVELTQTAGDMADVMLSADAEQRPVDLGSTVESEVERIRSEQPDAAVTVESPLPDVAVTANDLLNSVVRNLLTNAVQHNDRDVPEITVSVDEQPETVAVRVADNGPGVPDEQKTEVFGKGEKGLESQGSGIGLYLVKTLVETYGGDVRVEDNAPRGAVFVAELPRAD